MDILEEGTYDHLFLVVRIVLVLKRVVYDVNDVEVMEDTFYVSNVET